MGIIKEIKEITSMTVNEDQFNKIKYWHALYQGYVDDGNYIYEYKTLEKKQKRRLLTLNMPKFLCEKLATIVFNEKVKINIDNEKAQDYIDEVLKDNNFYSMMQSNYERSLALGGMVIKPYFKKNKIKLTFVSANSFFPTKHENGKIKAGVFVNKIKKGKLYLTHLESHYWEEETYVIKNEMYMSENKEMLGVKIPVKNYLDVEEIAYFNGLKSNIMFVYIKNSKANNFDESSPLGISIYANAIDTIETIDRMFDSLNREFKLGKKRIFLSSSMVKSVPDGNGNMIRYFDAEDETYEVLNNYNDDEKITESKIELRVDEHIKAINIMLSVLAVQIGFSAGTFTFDGSSLKTATEVVSEKSETFKTKQSNEVVLNDALKDLVYLIDYLSQAYNLKNMGEYEVAIKFDDSIAEDKKSEIARIQSLVISGLIPKYKAISEIHGISEDEAKSWIVEMKRENEFVDDVPYE